MKAILVVDLPNDVNMDRVIQTPVTLSFDLGGIKQLMFADGYLKPLPKKFDLSEDRRDGTGHIASRVWYRRHQGWNDCLEEILK